MILQMIFTLLDTQACTAPGCGARLSQGWGSALQSVAKLASLFLLFFVFFGGCLPPITWMSQVRVGRGGAGPWEPVLMVCGPSALLGTVNFKITVFFLFYVSCQQGIDTYPVRGLVPLVAIFLQGRVSGVFKIPC